MVKLVCLDCGQTNRLPAEKLAAAPKCGTCGAPMLDGKVHEVDPDTLAKAIRVDELPLVADFWASWCGPCRMMAPEFSKAAAVLAGRARLVKLDTERYQRASGQWNVRALPTLVAFRGGREKERQAGALPASAIVDLATRAG